MTMDWTEAFNTCPLVAILRDITPEEILSVVEVLLDSGFTLIEVPLNSPRALESIRLASASFGSRAILGAGTVLKAEQVLAVSDAGGRLIVAPNFDPRVAEAARRQKMIYGPGVTTTSEAFAALEAGADFLKLFPAEMITPATVRALRTVLPKAAPLLPVGGISPDTMQAYFAAGADGFGLGSALYKPGFAASEVRQRAIAFRTALSEGRNTPAKT